mmetsp:Transcript_6976/g.8701  ORF Transcript_6976/g.8701 Transcript_6976/m.8701 type:complete len:102 (-) Transcript_6976:452-757(-)|eukprot:CAMPEP_0203644262 /NCGR_PEP_ID=MMETSP0088-20131115/9692_1 /ASSEMBLY_ACC=CAM_ASM_001087 /TAXON_ID=426623 /ORGANISM="Chaetoceros affinis, Strain CCMP159" /LENGTH=101 /DNA_ID=CAMNT_0050500707 /DNA_START=90 /DNA_END=395 /DNA_ORIENTATION=+
MSFFGGGQQEAPTVDPLFAAQTEMEMVTVSLNKIVSTCFTKCASRKHKDKDLQLGEMSCIDRCTAKYLDAQEKVGLVLQKANEEQAKQMQNMQQMQNAFGG